MQHDDYDIAIIGAGMIGASLACALAPTGLRIAIIESFALNHQKQPSYDDRGIALAPSSRRIFEQINIWSQLQSALVPIKKIHVSEQGRFGCTRLDATEMAMPELGHVIVARTLGKILHQQLLQFDNITLICPAELIQLHRAATTMNWTISHSNRTATGTARLLVGADGRQSSVRRLANIHIKQHDFKQTAIVCNITTQKPNEATAYERFTPHGPIALLPIGDHHAVLILTTRKETAEAYLAMAESQYRNIIQTELGRRLGKIEKIGQRQTYPITFTQALTQYQQQLVLLGNAAHSIHPNGAQGFNLGLRDVAGLTECLFAAIKDNIDLADIRILQDYVKLRAPDQQRVIDFSNRLAACFYNQSPLLMPLRNAAMIFIDTALSLKKPFVKQAMGLAGLQPQFVQGQSLHVPTSQ